MGMRVLDSSASGEDKWLLWTVGFHKMRAISWPAKVLPTCQEVFRYIELVEPGVQTNSTL
jgi:hypothetical protein